MNPQMSDRFLAFSEWLAQRESVFKRGHHGDLAFVTHENDPDDPGGLTKFGIDQRSHPSVNIKGLTWPEAREIYWREYWLPVAADTLPDGWGEVMVDTKVNGGDWARMAQRAANATGQMQLVVDGKIGPLSVQGMNDAGDRGLRAFLQARLRRYEDLVRRKPRMKKFLTGWRNRIARLAALVGVAPVS